MKADTIEVMGLFNTNIRYLIPIFQRNYKWGETGQWSPLWTDISNVAQDVLEMGESGEVPDHFLGAIVCEQIPSFGRDAHAISVIDGQQRLATPRRQKRLGHRIVDKISRQASTAIVTDRTVEATIELVELGILAGVSA